jgi:putative sigma-54 modulation protein
MQIALHTRSIVAADLEPLVTRRAGFALGRFADRIRRLTLRIDDVNGPRGGYGIECHAIVEFAAGGTLVVKGLARNASTAACDVIERLRATVQRNLERHRTLR